MQLKDYIQGNRRGKEANLFEREAMNDPFLQGAIDGFDTVAGDHAKIIEQLEVKYKNRHIIPTSKNKTLLYWAAAASVLLLIGIGTFIFMENDRQSMPMLAEMKSLDKENVIPAESIVEDSEYTEEFQAEPVIVEKKFKKVDPKPAPPEISPIKVEKISNISAEKLADISLSSDLTSDQADHRVVEAEISETQKIASMDDAITISKESARIQSSFGEKEFQTWCKQRVDKNVCSGKGASVKVTFFINETGKPINFDFQKYSCEEAKNEVENLLSSSPVWTKTNRKVSITVKW